MGTYVMVARTRASAVFYPGDSFSVNVSNAGGSFTLVFRTTYLEGFGAPVPKDFWVEARGPANDVNHATELFANAAMEVSCFVALTANASMGALEPELVFDATAESEEHEFLQVFVADPPLTIVPARRVNIEVLRATLQALDKHPERPRIQRSAVQYVEALQSWRPGGEITCLAHLYMGVEAITKAVLREHLRKAGQSEDEIAMEWGVNEPDKLKRRKGIDSEARRRLVFRGDAECFRKARRVSDAFEHGFSDFGEIRKPATEVIVRTAEYLRRAIIETIGIDRSLQEIALGADYNKPRGPLRVVRYLRGCLTGKSEQLAAEDQLYPIMEWRTKLKTVQVGDDGKYQFSFDDTFKPKLGIGVNFRPLRHEIWDGSTINELSADATAQQENGVQHSNILRSEAAFWVVNSSASSLQAGTTPSELGAEYQSKTTGVGSTLARNQMPTPYGGLLIDPIGIERARSVAGGLMMNFASVELFTIVLLRLLMPANRRRRDLIQGELRPRLDAVIRRLPRTHVLDSETKQKLRDALKAIRAMLKARDVVAYDPYLNIQGEWVWAQLRDAEPDFRMVTSVSLDRIAAVNDQLLVVAQELERLLAPYIGAALSSHEGV